MSDKIKPVTLEFFELKTFALTFDNNIIFWQRETNTIECYGMLS